MSRVFLSSSLRSVPLEDLRATIEQILTQLEDQINAGPSIASLVNPTDALPQGMVSGDVIFNIQNGELRAGVYNGISVLYASFGSFVGAITDAQHGTRSGGNLHPDATTAVSGFMSAGDKIKSDHYKGSLSFAGAVSLTQLPIADDWCFFTDTTGPTYQLAVNFAGSIKTVALT